MVVDVVFLKQGSPALLHSNGFKFAWREEGGGQVRADMWKRAALELVHLASKSEAAPVDVFLCLKTQFFAELLDRKFISDLLELACNYSWGANVYVVTDVSQELLRSPIDLNPYLDSLCNWFRAIYESGATDIIQARFNTLSNVEVWNDTDSLIYLLSSADRSRERHKALSLEGEWKGLLRKESGMLKRLLSDFDIYTDSNISHLIRGGNWEIRGGNWVVVMEDISSNAQTRMWNKVSAVRPDKGIVVMGDLMKTSRLSDYIDNLKRNADWKIAWYSGSFELQYLFHLLSNDLPPSPTSNVGRVEIIQTLSDPLMFQQSRVVETPSMLVTSSFPSPNTTPNQWHSLQAAIEVGKSVIRKPAHAAYIVSPSTDCENLPAALDNLPLHLTAWLHVGHGNKEHGLQESSGEFRSAQRWLDSFLGRRSRGGSLSLAIFSACHSEEIARKFAQAGVGVAIGFEKPVPGDACRILTSPLISAALRSGGDREAILRTFHKGCADLVAYGFDGDRHLRPVAFCSKHQ
jgi:hypothetical protein